MPKAKVDPFSRRVNIVFNLAGEKNQLIPDLSDEEMFAIGRVMVSWAYLEHAILDDCVRMADAHRTTVPDGAFVVALKPRLRVWREMITKFRRGKPREHLLKTISRIENAQSARNRITHGLWSWEYSSPERITAKSYKPRFGFNQHFDFMKLMKLGDVLGEINFELRYPKGETEAMKSLAARPLGMSRDFALIMMGKGKPRPPLSAEDEKRVSELLAKIETPPKRGGGNMRLFTITELMRLTRMELCDLIAQIAHALPINTSTTLNEAATTRQIST
jgi:hypothetical protein